MADIKTVLRRLESEMQSVSEERDNSAELNRLHELMLVYEGEDKVESSFDVLERVRGRGEEVVYPTGIQGLDKLLHGGFRPTQSILISAITKHGKTEFCIYLTQTMKETKPLWFSFEDGPEELVKRFIDIGAEVPLFYAPAYNKHKTVEWIEERMVESMAKYGTKMVFVDNLQNLIPRGQNQSVEIGFVTKALKDLALKWNVVIVVVSHLKKVQMDRQPDLDDIKGSADPAQDANTVIMLWRQNNRSNGQVVFSNNVNCSVQAARRGKTGNVKLVFDEGIYKEINWEDGKETNEQFAALG